MNPTHQPLSLALGMALWLSGHVACADPVISGTVTPASIPADAVPEADASPAERWVIGATLASTPTYSGGAERQLRLRPILAGRVGRWQVSTSSARVLAGIDSPGGISTTVIRSDRWSMSAGLRLTQGRKSADDAFLAGMPDLSSSLALRASLGYALTPQWRATLAAQQDLLHGQGLRIQSGLGWSTALPGGWAFNAGGGVSWVDARAMSTFHGVEPDQVRANRPVWQPGAGLESWNWGLGLSRALTPRWRVAATVGQSTLLGDAAHSPLTQRRQTAVAGVTLAYVSR